MGDENLASKQTGKNRGRKWVKYERTYSNSMWHTGYKRLDDGRWFISYEDDASRLLTGFGVFDEATTEHAIRVLHQAISRYGKPASILTDHGSQFYASAAECKGVGGSEFEKELVRLGIRQILARAMHPQTNGKLARFHGEMQRKLHFFIEASAGKTVHSRGEDSGHVGSPFHTKGETDPVSRFVDWYNNDRPHMSLDRDKRETPAQAFARKMPPNGEAVIDEQTGEEYHGN